MDHREFKGKTGDSGAEDNNEDIVKAQKRKEALEKIDRFLTGHEGNDEIAYLLDQIMRYENLSSDAKGVLDATLAEDDGYIDLLLSDM